jgi:hypothetical protein
VRLLDLDEGMYQSGYGSLRFGGANLRAHRLSWQLSNGVIPEGGHILHRCDIPQCVNPDHLFLGTHSDNMRDKERKGRGNHATGERNGRHTKPAASCRGDAHWMRRQPQRTLGALNNRAVLKEADIIFIRNSSLSGAELGRLFGITKTHANRVRARKSWSHS